SRDVGGDDLEALLQRAPYPCVVKPLVLSGSRGVIRADDPQALRAALKRVAALLTSPDVAQRRDADLERVLIEEFVPGPEVTLEELILRHALGMTGEPPPREKRASGVVMLPIRRRGVLEEVRGVEEARHVPLVEDVAITAHLREELVPLPEGASYLGFVFARGDTPEQVEQALRQAGARIEAVVTPTLAVT